MTESREEAAERIARSALRDPTPRDLSKLSDMIRRGILEGERRAQPEFAHGMTPEAKAVIDAVDEYRSAWPIAFTSGYATEPKWASLVRSHTAYLASLKPKPRFVQVDSTLHPSDTGIHVLDKQANKSYLGSNAIDSAALVTLLNALDDRAEGRKP